jgi:hypothetical protein
MVSIFLAAESGLSNVEQLLSCVLSSPVLKRGFSIINCYLWNERNKSSVNLIKSKIAVKTNYGYICKDLYTFVHKDNYMLEAAKSTRICFQIKKKWTKTNKQKIFIFDYSQNTKMRFTLMCTPVSILCISLIKEKHFSLYISFCFLKYS